MVLLQDLSEAALEVLLTYLFAAEQMRLVCTGSRRLATKIIPNIYSFTCWTDEHYTGALRAKPRWPGIIQHLTNLRLLQFRIPASKAEVVPNHLFLATRIWPSFQVAQEVSYLTCAISPRFAPRLKRMYKKLFILTTTILTA